MRCRVSIAWIWGKMTSFTTTYLYIYKCPANETTVRQNSLTPMPLIFVKNSVIHSAIEKHCYEIKEACRCTISSDIWVHLIQIFMNGYIYIYIADVCIQHVICFLTRWSQRKMAIILQTPFSNAFSWMEILFSLEFHLSLFLEILLTICQYQFRWCLGVTKVTI